MDIDGFIQDLGGEFLKFVETYIECLEIARNNEIIGEDTKIKARIKDYSSAYKNTENKELDDMFGMESVASTEEEKEFLMLFNQLLFDIQKDKKFQKKNGYEAYHCVGDYSIKDDKLDERIKYLINNATTKLRTDNPINADGNNQKNEVKVFSRLQKVIANDDEYTLLRDTLEAMLKKFKSSQINREQLPLIEFHCITSSVEQSAIRGTASHSNYKDTNEELITTMFTRGQLYRGINTPWKFTSKEGKLVLQNIYETLIENWPFLRKYIVERRKTGLEEQDIENNNNCDILLATQYSFLEKYVKDNGHLRSKSMEEMWGALKLVMLNLRVDEERKEEYFKQISPRFITSLFSTYGLIGGNQIGE